MIDQILKDRKPGDNPRFFLHDEIKAWLGDHLKIQLVHSENHSMDYDLQRKLGLSNTLPVIHNISLRISVDDELISQKHIRLPMEEYEKAIKTLSNVCQSCMMEINHLNSKVAELQQRIDQSEKPTA